MASKKTKVHVPSPVARKKRASLQLAQKRASRRLTQILSTLVEVRPLASLLKKNKIQTSSLQAEIQVISPQRMAKINLQWRGKAYATDILSFPTPDFFQQQGHLGELVLCWSTLEKQARGCKHSPAAELDILLVHGILHLLGLDHERSARELQQQAKLESLLLNHLGSRAQSGLIDRMNSSPSRDSSL